MPAHHAPAYAPDVGGAGRAAPNPARDGAAPFSLVTLGPFRLLGPDGPVDLGSRKLCGLLALLAAATPRPVSRERLTSLLWGSHFDTQAHQNLRQALARLRRLLGPDAILAVENGLALQPTVVSADVPRFEALVREGGRASLAEAAGLYGGSFLSDVAIAEQAWTEWLSAERGRLESLAVDALVRWGEIELAEGAAEQAVTAGQRAVAIDDLREDAHRLVMRALAAVGRRAQALRHFDQLTAALRRTLQVDPDEATRALAAEIRAGTAGHAEPQQRPGPGDLSRVATEHLSGQAQAVLVAAPLGEGGSDILREACRREEVARAGQRLPAAGPAVSLRFPDARAATAAGLAILRATAGRSATGLGLHLSSSAGSGEASEPGLQLATRLSTLARPGEIVASEAARAQITSAVDAEIEDLGEFPDLDRNGPVRAYRVTAHDGPSEPGLTPAATLWPTVAVIPFATETHRPEHAVIGELLADEIIAGLSRTAETNVISRLSTTALRGRNAPLEELGLLLGASYVLSGRCQPVGSRLRLTMEFSDVRSANVIWADRLEADLAEAVTTGGLVDDIIERLRAAMMRVEGARARMQALPTLENSTLMLGAISLMHRLSLPSVETAREMLEILIARAPRHPMPHAWLAHLYILRASQGWSRDVGAEAERAIASTERALDLEPDCSLALAVSGHVQTHFFRRFDLAAERFESAVEANPNDSLAWLLESTMHAFRGEGGRAVADADRALRLSPLDPRRWYYDSLAATAFLAAGDYGQAIALARRSLKGNRAHTSTLRAMAIAQELAGQGDEARATVESLLKLQPDLTVAQYRARHPACAFEIGGVWAAALARAGLPES